MRVLLDECLPRRFGAELPGHIVTTVQKAGLAGLKNGALLARLGNDYDAFITVDRNLPAQNDLASRAFGVIVLSAPSNRIADVRPLASQVLQALATITPGQIVRVSARP